MLRQERTKKTFSPGKIIGLILILLLAEPQILGILLGIALFLSPVWVPLIIYFHRKKHRKKHQSALEDTTYSPCRQEKAFQESRARYCFHDDKAIHHVARGKEVDPWDRPDIDISKYQRKE